MRHPVFVDVDTGVDDALALLYLLASTEAELVGIASTAGNVAVEQVCRNNLGLLRLCGETGVPVSRGAEKPLRGPLPVRAAHGPAGIGYAELPPGSQPLTGYDAATAWVRAAHAHPGRLIAVATGPLTNLALALRAEPALPTLLHRLVIMGGAFKSPMAEWNISVDPEAAVEVFAAFGAARRLPIVCGMELADRVAMTPEHLRRLAAVADSATNPVVQRGSPEARRSWDHRINPVIRMIEDAVRFYFEVHDERGHGYLVHLHDPLAAAVALDLELVTTRPTEIDVALTDTRGRTRLGAGQPNALIGLDIDPVAFFDRFIDRVGVFARRLDRCTGKD